jgi:hypothetical protein
MRIREHNRAGGRARTYRFRGFPPRNTRHGGVRRRLGSAALLLFLPGCATLQGILALRQVEFALDRVHEVRLAGVLLDRIDRPEDVGALDLARILAAVAQGNLPLTLTLDVAAVNPEGNPEARLAALDWTLFLQDRETVSGGLPAPVRIPVAGRATIPLQLQLDLVDFLDGSAQDLLNLALSFAGEDVPETELRLEAIPTVETSVGPIRYPQPIVIRTTR